MHFSRMRTARLLAVSPSMHCTGVSAPRGVSAPGGVCSRVVVSALVRVCLLLGKCLLWLGGVYSGLGCVCSWGCLLQGGLLWGCVVAAHGWGGLGVRVCIPACTEADTPL